MMKTTMHWVVRHGGLPYLMRAHLGSRATIVSYHGVVSDEDWRDWETSDMVSVSAFRRHLTFYRRHYDVIPLRRVADALAGRGPKLPRRSLAITLDDGYCNNLHCALPVLREHDCPATVFVTTGFLDGTV